MVRAIEGQGFLITRYPPDPSSTDFPALSTMSTSYPGRGWQAEPGFVGVTAAVGEITMAPVSVCQYVSTIGQRRPPMFSRYHIHASGLIGSPTVPSTRKELKS